MRNPYAALMEWYAAVKPGGHLVFTVPDEDLYEQGVFPSKWNQDHKWTFTLWKDGSWSKKSLNVPEVTAILHNAQVRRIHLCDTEYDYSMEEVDQTFEGTAEAFIEVVIRKMPNKRVDGQTFKHSGARGDLIYAMPAMKALGGGVLMINFDPTQYLGNCIANNEVSQFRELMKGEDCVDEVVEWDGSIPTYDLDDFREVDADANLLSQAHLTRFGVDFDLSKPWLFVEPRHVAKIVVSRTWRYHGPLEWDELQPWVDQCVFVGSEDEYRDFREATLLEIPHEPTPTFMDLARVIAGSDLFVGNQSFPYSLAEAMKVQRVLEVCPTCPNCTPQGDAGFTRLTQDIIEHCLSGSPLLGSYDSRSHLPWKIKELHAVKMESPNKASIRPSVSCVVPFRKGHDKDIERLRKGAENTDAQVIVGTSEGGTFEQMANALAEKATGDVICVVDIALCSDYADVAMLVSQFTIERLGIVAATMSLDSYPHPSGPCVAVSRKAYHECGLFNTGMASGRLGVLEMSLRYGRRRWSSKAAATGRWECRQAGDEGNAEYIRKVYGVKV
jgi:hypothetical protein